MHEFRIEATYGKGLKYIAILGCVGGDMGEALPCTID